MNWQLIITIALTLANPFQLGTASTPVAGPVMATIDDVTASGGVGAVTEVPFTIDTGEVEKGAYISGGSLGFNWHQLGGQTSGVLHLEGLTKTLITRMSLSASDGSVIAQDLIIPGVKTALTFNAEANALADIVGAAALYGASADEQIAIYERARNHPQFAQLEAIYRDAKGWPSKKAISERTGELVVIIAFDLMEELRGATEN